MRQVKRQLLSNFVFIKYVLALICCFSFLPTRGQSSRVATSDIVYLAASQHSEPIVEEGLLRALKQQNNIIPISVDGRILQLEIKPSPWLDMHNLIKNAPESTHDYISNSSFYFGKIVGDSNSLVAISVFPDKASILIHADSYQLEANKVNGKYLWTKGPINNIQDLQCMTPDMDVSLPRDNNSRLSFGNCLELSLKTDYALYQLCGSNLTTLFNFYTSTMNVVGTIFNNHGVPITILNVDSNTSPDAYTNSLTATLQTFVTESQGGISGKVGFLMSGRLLGGGLAQGIGGYCNNVTTYPGPFAVAGNYTLPSVNYPTFSYNAFITAHELGHVMGLRHSHACVWNGNNSQIDDCGNVYAANNNNTPEGQGCYNSSSPILPGTSGTLMSNCHLLNGQGINFSLGFGSQPGALLFSQFANAPCVTGRSCANIPPANDLCSNAFPLTVSTTCQAKTYDNVGATGSGSSIPFSCGSTGSVLDVWFKVLVPSSGSVTISTIQVAGGLTDMVIQTYSGACSSLTPIACDDNNGPDNHALIVLTGRTPGETIYVRVIDSGSNDFGEFGICAYDSSVPCHPDLSAMLIIYNTLGGSTWINKTGWSQGAAGTNCNVCTWAGVVCDGANRVTQILLPSNNLTGPISTQFNNLPFLNRVNLFGNGLTGTPLSSLLSTPLISYIDLGQNNLSGNVAGLVVGPNLRTLYLDNNNFSGSLPVALGNSNLLNLWLNNNSFSGCIPNSYFNLCQNEASVRLQSNIGLPFGGDFSNLCLDSLGADIDNDTYCGGAPDCNDTLSTVYPNAPELCDGIDNDCDGSIDEFITPVTNQWLALTSDWHNPTNWSTGRVPLTCHNVMITPSAPDSVFVYSNNSAIAASVTIGNNGILHIQNLGNLNITQLSGVTNNGTLSLFGSLNIISPTHANYSLQNSGMLTISSSGRLNITNHNNGGIFNMSTGSIINSGLINIKPLLLSSLLDIRNLGNIDNRSIIQIRD